MSLFAGTGAKGGKAGASKKLQQTEELGPKYAALKVLLNWSLI